MAKRTSETEKRTGKTTKNRQAPKPARGGGKAETASAPAPATSEQRREKSSRGSRAAAASPTPKKTQKPASKSQTAAKTSPAAEAGKTDAKSGPRKAAPKRSGSNGRGGEPTVALGGKTSAKRAAAASAQKSSKIAPPPRIPAAKDNNGRPAGVLQAARSVASRATKIAESPKVRRTQLTPAELAEFREILLAKRHELVTDMANLEDEARRGRSESGPASSAMPIHMADLGSDTWEQEFTLNLIEKERTIVREIDEALDRIENKTFGICLATGKPITKARLRAKPWAKYCIEYARKRELGLA